VSFNDLGVEDAERSMRLFAEAVMPRFGETADAAGLRT
jgi:hypothetical protein